jgi:hypothetical protein
LTAVRCGTSIAQFVRVHIKRLTEVGPLNKPSAGDGLSRRTFVRVATVGVPAGAIAAGAVAWYAWPAASGPTMGTPATPATAGAWKRRETRPTLDPARFVGKPAEAHRVARNIPDVLDQLYCYCECDKSIGHKSLLSCYTDGHAAT